MTRSGVWILLVSLAAPAAAQDSSPFSELARRIGTGDDVRVTLRGGRSLKAQIAEVTPSTLSVLDSGGRRDLGPTVPHAARRRSGRGDSGRTQRKYALRPIC